MKIRATFILALSAAMLAVPMTAQAAQRPGASIPLCVTTTWRANHTHMPKTQPGQICLATPDMWIPKSYITIGVMADDKGIYDIVLRTR